MTERETLERRLADAEARPPARPATLLASGAVGSAISVPQVAEVIAWLWPNSPSTAIASLSVAALSAVAGWVVWYVKHRSAS